MKTEHTTGRNGFDSVVRSRILDILGSIISAAAGFSKISGKEEKKKLREQSSVLSRHISGLIGIISIQPTEKTRGITSIFVQLLNLIDGLHEEHKNVRKRSLTLVRMASEYARRVYTGSEGIPDEISEKKLQSMKLILEKTAAGENTDLDDFYARNFIVEQMNEAEYTIRKLCPSQFIEMPLKAVEKIVSSANELIISQYELRKKLDALTSLINTRDEVTSTSDSPQSMPQRHTLRLQEVKKKKSDSERDLREHTVRIEHAAFALQEQILSLRLFPARILGDEIKKWAGILSVQHQKIIECVFSADPENIVIDKEVIDAILDPLYGIVENAVVHGFKETVQGVITFSVTEKEQMLAIRIQDNGKGIDYHALREKCALIFPHKSDEFITMDDAAAAQHLFLRGFGNSENPVSKGIPLCMCADKIHAIKGTIRILKPDTAGFALEISIAKTLTAVNGYYIRSGSHVYFIPSMYILEVVITDTSRIVDLITKPALPLRNEMIPLYPLKALFEYHTSSHDAHISVLIVTCHDEAGNPGKIAVSVDEILYHSSAMFSQLPGAVKANEFLQGTVLDDNFRIIPVLFIPKMVEKLQAIRDIRLLDKYSPNSIEFKSILIADDSSTSRNTLAALLEKNKLRVTAAHDGIDALAKMQAGRYDLLITDTDMPRMDGLTLIENMRRESGYEKIPVIILAAGMENAEQKKYETAGVQAFHIKSSFDRERFLKDIHLLTGIK